MFSCNMSSKDIVKDIDERKNIYKIPFFMDLFEIFEKFVYLVACKGIRMT